MKMQFHVQNLILCAVITATHLTSSVSPATTTMDADHKIVSQEEQTRQPRTHPTMSCYACSTMDYENPADNLCRVMRVFGNSPGIHPKSHNFGYHSYSPIQTTSTTAATTSSSSTPSTIDGVDKMPTMAWSSEHQTTTSDYYEETTQNSDLTTRPIKSKSGSHNNGSHASQQTSLTTASEGRHLPHQYRNSPPGNFIRTRPCFEGENFCSLVSIVRIEFANDNLFSRFWALERNCSKSCNNGCMLIGERVRLRVCSQCCRTPNCNIGSGKASLFEFDTPRFIVLVISIIMGLLYPLTTFQTFEGNSLKLIL